VVYARGASSPHSGGGAVAAILNRIAVRRSGQGPTYKETIPAESDDPDVEIEREVLRTSAVALDLRSGRFEVIGQGIAAE
jgi:hypothetical protein